MLAGVGADPGRSHRCVAVNSPHDHPKFLQFGAKAAPTGAAIQSGTRRDVMCWEALAFQGIVLPNRLTSMQCQSTDRQRSQRAVGLLPGCVGRPRSKW